MKLDLWADRQCIQPAQVLPVRCERNGRTRLKILVELHADINGCCATNMLGDSTAVARALEKHQEQVLCDL